DIPLYNGIHFVLNGIRGLVMPWVGSVLFVCAGPAAVLAATVVSLGSIPVILRSIAWGEGPEQESVLCVVGPDAAEKSAGQRRKGRGNSHLPARRRGGAGGGLQPGGRPVSEIQAGHHDGGAPPLSGPRL